MTITTQYNLGSVVYFLSNNIINVGVVRNISVQARVVDAHTNDINIFYILDGFSQNFTESQLFSDTATLITSLEKGIVEES